MKALTPVGVANVLVRGIRANFSTEKQEGEIERLAEYLESLCMAREDEIEYAALPRSHSRTRFFLKTHGGDDSALAERDSNFLFSVVRELEKL